MRLEVTQVLSATAKKSRPFVNREKYSMLVIEIRNKQTNQSNCLLQKYEPEEMHATVKMFSMLLS